MIAIILLCGFKQADKQLLFVSHLSPPILTDEEILKIVWEETEEIRKERRKRRSFYGTGTPLSLLRYYIHEEKYTRTYLAEKFRVSGALVTFWLQGKETYSIDKDTPKNFDEVMKDLENTPSPQDFFDYLRMTYLKKLISKIGGSSKVSIKSNMSPFQFINSITKSERNFNSLRIQSFKKNVRSILELEQNNQIANLKTRNMIVINASTLEIVEGLGIPLEAFAYEVGVTVDEIYDVFSREKSSLAVPVDYFMEAINHLFPDKIEQPLRESFQGSYKPFKRDSHNFTGIFQHSA